MGHPLCCSLKQIWWFMRSCRSHSFILFPANATTTNPIIVSSHERHKRCHIFSRFVFSVELEYTTSHCLFFLTINLLLILFCCPSWTAVYFFPICVKLLSDFCQLTVFSSYVFFIQKDSILLLNTSTYLFVLVFFCHK